MHDAMDERPVLDRASFRHWSAQLYCSGVQEQRCAMPDGAREQSGHCYWQRMNAAGVWQPLTGCNTTGCSEADGLFGKRDRFNPEAFGAPGYRRLQRDAAAQCVHGKKILLLGDSTTRDTYYELLAAAGMPIWAFKRFDGQTAARWPNTSWAPATSKLGPGDAISSYAMDRGTQHLPKRLLAKGLPTRRVLRGRRLMQRERGTQGTVCMRERPLVWQWGSLARRHKGSISVPDGRRSQSGMAAEEAAEVAGSGTF